MPGFPALPYLPDFAQIHVHWVSDAIQPSHPLSPPSLALNPFQHQGLFQQDSFTMQAKSIYLSKIKKISSSQYNILDNSVYQKYYHFIM